MIPTAKTRMNKKLTKYLSTEIDVMIGMDSPLVLGLIDAKKTKNNIYLFFQFCNGGDLRDLIEAFGGTLPENIVKIITTQICQGLAYLNTKSVIHRDLKLDNILLHYPAMPAHEKAPKEFL